MEGEGGLREPHGGAMWLLWLVGGWSVVEGRPDFYLVGMDVVPRGP